MKIFNFDYLILFLFSKKRTKKRMVNSQSGSNYLHKYCGIIFSISIQVFLNSHLFIFQTMVKTSFYTRTWPYFNLAYLNIFSDLNCT